ncbi:MAG: hypothetical protein ACRCWI_02685 [Brevinema sp.]
MRFYLLLFLPILLHTQYATPFPPLPTREILETNIISEYTEPLSNDNIVEDTTPENNTLPNTNLYSPPYKTSNYRRFKTKKIPQLLTSEGMLQNLDNSYWSLKFHSHPDIALYENMTLHFKDNKLNLKAIGYTQELLEDLSFLLSPVKMFKPNEGIFAYSDPKGQIYFVYLHLLLQHLLAMKIVTSYEEAEQVSQQSLTELGIFTLQ